MEHSDKLLTDGYEVQGFDLVIDEGHINLEVYTNRYKDTIVQSSGLTWNGCICFNKFMLMVSFITRVSCKIYIMYMHLTCDHMDIM